jgi:tRNA (mo5U34)-methyltransferase
MRNLEQIAWRTTSIARRSEARSEESRMNATEIDTLREKVRQTRWFHSIDLGHGIVTPGGKSPDIHRTECAVFLDPIELHGRTVIDIGAASGFYSFEAKRRGAARVLATDYPPSAERDGFELARSVLNLDIEAKAIEVCDLSVETVGQFDVVLFLGVFYHLLDPIAGLEQVSKLASEVLVVESHIDGMDVGRPAMIMYPGAELNNDPFNWWGPNPDCMLALLRKFGFAKVDAAWTQKHGRAVFHAWRSDALRRFPNPEERVIDPFRLSRRQKLRRGWRLIRQGLGLRRE